MRAVFTEKLTDNPIFYKDETYLDRILPEIYVKPNFMKIVKAVLGTHIET